MKLASLKSGRDGRLIVVSRDLEHAVSAESIAPTLQFALDNWEEVCPLLQALSATVNSGANPDAFPFKACNCSSPLPRAYQWADGSAYVNHVELVRQARGAEMPDSFWTDPLMYQGGSDCFLGPHEDIPISDVDWGLDMEGEIAVIVDDTPSGIKADDAEDRVRLVMLVNDVSLRNLIPQELGKGFGFFQSKPSSAFSPVAVTTDELGEHWQDGKLKLPLRIRMNGKEFGRPNAGVDMTFSFSELIAHAAKSRALSAGTIIGSGTVSNKEDGGPGRSIAEGGAGYSCIAEQRVIEKIKFGKSKTPFLSDGDRVEIEMLNGIDESIFGRIDQRVRLIA